MSEWRASPRRRPGTPHQDSLWDTERDSVRSERSDDRPRSIRTASSLATTATPSRRQPKARRTITVSLDAASTSSSAGVGSPSGVYNKAGRVRVAIRCRPPFDDEAVDGVMRPVVHVSNAGPVPKVSLEVDNRGKRREFLYDFALGPNTTQDDTYNIVARPIVEDVLRGFHGTVMAYGQTGTGKTYTMGILDRLDAKPNGLIPMSLQHVFSHIAANPHIEWNVSVSFLQIYLESIQDLLVLPSEDRVEENLAIREDPRRGCFADGLQEYTVRNYDEAVELLNWGLENRVMASTLMNITSSRSHTVLTVHVHQSGSADEDLRMGHRILRGKLILVDLAGSERVRRTTSKGARLSEARAINSSLSALGNVIAALASAKATHVPYRDSKLTRLLTDSLGGRANTVLVATVGPAAINQSETLSTLLFASRCMHVRSAPVLDEEVDYAALCAQLQSRLANVEQDWLKRESALTDRYERQIHALSHQLEAVKRAASDGLGGQALVARPSGIVDGLRRTSGPSDNVTLARLRMAYAVICDIYDRSADPIRKNQQRELLSQRSSQKERGVLESIERSRLVNVGAMTVADPLTGTDTLAKLGPHLPEVNAAEVKSRLERRFGSNNVILDTTVGSAMVVGSGGYAVPAIATPPLEHPAVEAFPDEASFSKYMEQLLSVIIGNNEFVSESLDLKDKHHAALLADQVNLLLERRTREEELVNWSYVLKYLLATNSQLRETLRKETSSLPRMELPSRAGTNSVVLAGGPSPLVSSLLERPGMAGLPGDEVIRTTNAATTAAVESDAASMIQSIYRKHLVHRPSFTPDSKPAVTEASIPPGPEGADSVEYIVRHRDANRGGDVQYKVHWRGTTSSEDEWFSRADLLLDYPTMLRAYDAEHGLSGAWPASSKPPSAPSVSVSSLASPAGSGSEEDAESTYSQLDSLDSSVAPSATAHAVAPQAPLHWARKGHSAARVGASVPAPPPPPRADAPATEATADIPGWLIVLTKEGWAPRWCLVEARTIRIYRIQSMRGSKVIKGAIVSSGAASSSGLFNFIVATSGLADRSAALTLVASSAAERMAWTSAIQSAVILPASPGAALPKPNDPMSIYMARPAFEGLLQLQDRAALRTVFVRLTTLSLDCYDVILETDMPLEGCEVKPTTVDVLALATESSLNPVWFQTHCRFTFAVTSRPGVASVEFGTRSAASRAIWMTTLDEDAAESYSAIRERGGGAAGQWVEAVDRNTGRKYWYHSITKQTVLTKPIDLRDYSRAK